MVFKEAAKLHIMNSNFRLAKSEVKLIDIKK